MSGLYLLLQQVSKNCYYFGFIFGYRLTFKRKFNEHFTKRNISHNT